MAAPPSPAILLRRLGNTGGALGRSPSCLQAAACPEAVRSWVMAGVAATRALLPPPEGADWPSRPALLLTWDLPSTSARRLSCLDDGSQGRF